MVFFSFKGLPFVFKMFFFRRIGSVCLQMLSSLVVAVLFHKSCAVRYTSRGQRCIKGCVRVWEVQPGLGSFITAREIPLFFTGFSTFMINKLELSSAKLSR